MVESTGKKEEKDWWREEKDWGRLTGKFGVEGVMAHHKESGYLRKKKLGWFKFDEIDEGEEDDGGEEVGPADSFTLVENGVTGYKRRTLERLGWDVVTIPFYEWQALGTERDKEEYLRTKVEELGVPKEKKKEMARVGAAPVNRYKDMGIFDAMTYKKS